MHWPSDVLAGLLMGAGWAAMWVWWWERAELADGLHEVSDGRGPKGASAFLSASASAISIPSLLLWLSASRA